MPDFIDSPVLSPVSVPPALAAIEGVVPFEAKYHAYLSDESRLTGWADSLSFPTSTAHVAEIVKACCQAQIPLICQGSRTGITGAGVPMGGHVMVLEQLNLIRVLAYVEETETQQATLLLTVAPGLSLAALNAELESGFAHLIENDVVGDAAALRAVNETKWFWPPDPSEAQASIGGIVSNNAGGICGHRYGRAGQHVAGLEWVDADGQVWSIHRGEYVFHDHTCQTPMGDMLSFDPRALGLSANADLVDVLVGGEGMLGVITGITLALQPAPVCRWAIVAFFHQDTDAAAFADSLKTDILDARYSHPLVALEYLDSSMLAAMTLQRVHMTTLQSLPLFPAGSQAALYLELHHHDVDAVENWCETLLMRLMEAGIEEDAMWAAMDESEYARLRQLRLLAPEVSNALRLQRAMSSSSGDPAVSMSLKIATDLKIEGSFSETLQRYKSHLYHPSNGTERVAYTLFGHALDNHLHLNLLPDNSEAQQLAVKAILHELVQQAADVKLNAEKKSTALACLPQSLSVEHGIGKLKAAAILPHLPAAYHDAYRQLKAAFDPHGVFNPHNRLQAYDCFVVNPPLTHAGSHSDAERHATCLYE
ncbi:FAD-binding oxidoreductase [Photobacterium aphoticum]|uniref:D-lactate dehydrogenase (cytochrome) n=1 Tax=Photobacterium aphoticum TaxID=754436 RepID=A0A0J1GPS2_9GAMM|nr:FAD-binding oxidoreductase [Photobacterium aphoticum]KLV01748.1 hypothetical protein ABT58_04750 [Photobacterium aphoticum]PSU58773.1 FAD-binding oxidoreductase [Photobacterium aphoticum]GHA32073.1 FAD-linked oxidase [Photobacterium aphoticum]